MSNKILAAGSVALMGAGSFMGAAPAGAIVEADCGEAPTNGFVWVVNDTICSVSLNMNSATDFTMPAGIDRLAALVIGAGGGSVSDGYAGYAGGGGEVLYVADVTVSDLNTIEIGHGGLSSTSYTGSTSGGDTTLGSTVARGGEFGRDLASSGDSGNGNTSWSSGGWDWNERFGGGAKSDASDGTPGAGYLLNDPELTLGDELFPAEDAPEFGRGGSGNSIPGEAAFGWGGSATSGDKQDGVSGGIIFRWIPNSAAASENSLAATGVDANSIGMTAGALGLGGVALAVVAAARRARRNK